MFILLFFFFFSFKDAYEILHMWEVYTWIVTKEDVHKARKKQVLCLCWVKGNLNEEK